MRLLGILFILVLFLGCTGAEEESPLPEVVVVETDAPVTTSPPTTTPPPHLENVAEAKALFEKTCDKCHSINYPATRGGRSYMAWVGTVNDMIDNGASITDEDAELIAKYLANLYGPE